MEKDKVFNPKNRNYSAFWYLAPLKGIQVSGADLLPKRMQSWRLPNHSNSIKSNLIPPFAPPNSLRLGKTHGQQVKFSHTKNQFLI